MSRIIDDTLPIVIKHDDTLMADVLKPYFKHTAYLKFADVYIEGDPAHGGKITGKGWFEIPSSCYIEDTGHFNSVEFNISYNQIMYYVIAASIRHKAMQVFNNWTLETYFKKQLPDILIVNLKSKFNKPLIPKRFYGEIDFIETKLIKSNSLIYIKTYCRYSDEPGKINCNGEVDLAIVKANAL
ncbi:MAG: FcoT family thioesterase [Candidatus Rickettsiella isopodorum]|nr:FcoT family thioesterase [Flavobacterium sp.]